MIAAIIHNMPPFVFFEGITFQFAMLGTTNKTLVLTYIITEVRADSPHYAVYLKTNKWVNRFEGGIPAKWLITSKDIRTDAEFRIALHAIYIFLRTMGIITKPIVKRHNYEKE